MSQALRCIRPRSLVAGIDFSTGAVKGLVFDLDGHQVAETRLPTDLWTAGGVSELNLMQLEGQARAVVRLLAAELRKIGLLDDWSAIGISATHHTAGRVDQYGNPIRRAICWNDHSLAAYHARGLRRLGGQDRARELTGGPWAARYTLTHLIKDEEHLSRADWGRTARILSHGSLAAGYLTGRFDVTSQSSAASTGLADLRTGQWALGMLDALESPEYRRLAGEQLPRIVDSLTPLGPVAESVALDSELTTRPLIFPTSDDQQAGLAGGGAVEPGELAVILGNSAVVNGSGASLPRAGSLDVMRLNWGPFLWMRCYNNGAQFLDRVVGTAPDWDRVEAEASAVPPGCNGVSILPFVHPEPSLGVDAPRLQWRPAEPADLGVRFRAALEALAYLVALGVREHERAGRPVHRLIVSGGIARSKLMGEILASVLGRPVERIQSNEGPALGAAVTALWGLENWLRKGENAEPDYAIADAVRQLVKYRAPVHPVAAWSSTYCAGLHGFERCLTELGPSTTAC